MRRGDRGFTLLEVMMALAVLGMVVMSVYQVLQNQVRGQDMVREGLRRPKIQNAILGQILRDFRYLHFDGSLVGDAGFIGKNKEVGGKDADIIDFVTARPSRNAHIHDDGARDDIPSPLTEVGYALRMNDENSDWLELWRREDWFVDSDPTKGGKYTLVYDKITKFDLVYFPIRIENETGKALDEWDTRAKNGRLPYAVVLDLKFDVAERGPDADEDELEDELIRRIIILKGAYNVEPDSEAERPPGQ